MQLPGLLVACMVCFGAVTAVREILLYRKALHGDVQYLVSRRRLNRRLLVSFVLIGDAILIYVGFYALNLTEPRSQLLYWIVPLFLTGVVVYLGMLDFRETRRDIDRIFQEAVKSALKKVEESKRS